ncbi:MAG: DMT family transporter [Actinobacteria bacterium]|nr:DMT family transporter [Actinomycetota bacterium]
MSGGDRRREGRLVMLVAAFAWSSAGVIQRTLETDAATQVACRALFAALTLFLLSLVTERGRVRQSFLSMGRSGVGIAALMAVSSAAFLYALNHSTVANVLFMQAVSPFIAALLGWVLLRERVDRKTWLAILVAIVGIVVMVGGPGSGSALGHGIAFVMSFAFAGVVVLTRHRRDISMIPAVCVSQVIVFVAFAPLSHPGSVGGRDLLLTAVLGGGQIGLGLVLLTIGARLLPPAEVAIISLLEVVLGPLWVWAAYAERPGTATLAGGAIVLLAVVLQSAELPRRLRQAPEPGG